MLPQSSAEEVARLRGCLNDLVSIMGLPAVWGGSEPPQIVATLLDALIGMLGLAFVFATLNDPDGGPSIEMMRVAAPLEGLAGPPDLGEALGVSSGPHQWLASAGVRLDNTDFRLASAGLGVQGDIGIVVAGSQRLDFPTQTETLLFEVATNQAALRLQQALLLSAQRRIATELDERVAQRTSELAAANKELKSEIAERRRAEAALGDSARESRLIIDTIPALVWAARPDGTAEFFNQHYLDFVGLSAEQAMGWRWTTAVHPADLDELAGAWQRIMSSGEAGATEARLRRFDGEFRWFLFRANPLRDESGTIVKWYGINTDIEDRKRAEDAIGVREQDLRQMTETIPEMLWSATPDGAIDYCNTRFLEYTGFSAQEVRGDGWQNTIHPDDAARVLPVWMSCVSRGTEYRVEVRTFHVTDRTYRWCAVAALPLRDEHGRILRWHGTAVDVHDWKQAQEELRQSERDARLIFECIPAQVAVLGPSGEVKQVNRRMMDFFGMSAEGLSGWRAGDIVPAGERPRVVAAMAKSLETGQPFEMENHLRRFDGVYRWFDIRGLPLIDSNGRAIHWYFVITDIEDRKQAEQALRRSEAFLAQAQRISLTGSFSWRLDTDEVIFSDELYRIFELDENAVVTLEQIGIRVHPDDMPLLSNLIDQVRESGGNPEYEMRLRMPDGRIKYTRTFSNVIHHPDGRRECLGAMQDVTQRRLSDEALDKARSELAHVTRSLSLGALTASIAHEVNQPLSGIITNASTCVRLLTADPPNVDVALETARRAIRDGNRAADVIARLRGLFSKKTVAAETVDLNDAAREVISLLSSDLQRSRVILRTELDDDSLLVTGDRVQLQQVILNLVRNATDAMSGVDDRPRQLQIRTERDEGDRVRLTVRDAGIGLDPKGVDKLFDAFYTTKHDGMGIGLSVSHSIIERHRGRLWAESNEGPGATFAFSIPSRSEDVADAPPT